MRKTWIGALAALVAGTGFLALAEGDPAAGAGLLAWQDRQVVARGEALYVEHCAACHGADLRGAPDWQVRGADGLMPAPPHDRTGHTWHHADEVLFAITRDGSEAVIGNGYRSAMRGFGDELNDDDILATLAYIKSTWPPDVIEIHDRINADYAARQAP